jgi:hypothetical protein
MYEKPLQINDLSLSEKEIIQDKENEENSVLHKSFFSTDFNVIDLFEKKNYCQIKIEPLELYIILSNKSIKKIFTLLSQNNGELENNYLDYITYLIGEGEELDNNKLMIHNNNQAGQQHTIDPTYFELLNRNKIYYIDIPNLNTNKKIDQKIILKKNSLEKIASFLNASIFDLCDYIEIFILSPQEKESLGERFLLKARMMGKSNFDSEELKKENELFSGHKTLNVDIKESPKCNRHKLEYLDCYFNDVWNAIEKEYIKDENLSFSQKAFDKNQDEENNNNDNINIINYDFPNSNNINDFRFKDNNMNISNDVKKESSCGENFCANLCEII